MQPRRDLFAWLSEKPETLLCRDIYPSIKAGRTQYMLWLP